MWSSSLREMSLSRTTLNRNCDSDSTRSQGILRPDRAKNKLNLKPPNRGGFALASISKCPGYFFARPYFEVKKAITKERDVVATVRDVLDAGSSRGAMMATLTKYAGDDAFAIRNPRSCDPDKFRNRLIPFAKQLRPLHALAALRSGFPGCCQVPIFIQSHGSMILA